MDKGEQLLEIMTKMNNKIDDGFKAVHSEINEIKLEMTGIKSEVTEMKSEITEIKSEMTEMNNQMEDGFNMVYSTMQEEFNHVYTEFKDIQMTLENETNKNIQLIAEGHFNLNRKLDDTLKVENEKELMLIRLTRLENEIRRLKTRIEESA